MEGVEDLENTLQIRKFRGKRHFRGSDLLRIWSKFNKQFWPQSKLFFKKSWDVLFQPYQNIFFFHFQNLMYYLEMNIY